jgi:flagellar hook-associated protein 2
MAALDFLGIGSNMQLGTLLDQLATADACR